MSKYEDLDVWKEAHKLTLEVYKTLNDFPKDEKYRINDQLYRAASSIAINISEGTGRNTNKDFLNFLYISRGSLHETTYILLLAKDLEFIDNDKYHELICKCNLVGRLLNALINSIKNKAFSK